MKLRSLIKKLQALEQKNGNMDVSIHDKGPDDEQQNPKAIVLMSFYDPKVKANKKGMKKADHLMLCGTETAHELS